jgi:DNA-binding NtrC family response regulator
MKKPRILIVDDNPLILESLRQLFMDDYEVVTVPSGIEALNILEHDSDFGAIILDIKMPKMDGLKMAERIQENNAEIPIIFYTGHPGDYSESDIERQYRPFDYITKNERPARLIRSVRTAVTLHHLKTHSIDLVQLARDQYDIIGHCQAMLDIYQTIERIAPTENKVMILGQTGTGKELVARAIHKRSLRASKKFEVLICNHEQQDLMADELFGHIRGSFTGAVAYRSGKFETADQGTLFLDEIGELNLNTQAKLLRVLETGELQRIGSSDTIKVDVRFICATNRVLKSMVKNGSFREDLYYRLTGELITMPPLKERQEDLPELIDYFMQKYSQKNGKAGKIFAPAALDMLLQYVWPGNVRQLQTLIGVLMEKSQSSLISTVDVVRGLEDSADPGHPVPPPTNLSMKEQVRCATKRIITEALIRNDYKISSTAAELKVDRTNLHKKIKKLNISVGNIAT